MTGQDTPEILARKYLSDRAVLWEVFRYFEGEATPVNSDIISKRLKRNFDRVRCDSRWLKVGALLWIPTHDAEGRLISWFCRPLPDLLNQKFLHPSGSSAPIWIPSETWEAAKDTSKPIIFIEGVFKALAYWQGMDRENGPFPIGIAGAWGLAPNEPEPKHEPQVASEE